jgi:hypothetical protein
MASKPVMRTPVPSVAHSKREGIVLKPFVIGVGLGDAEKYALQCVGNYFDASTPELFEHVLKVVVTQALNTTTAQISLMTADGKPLETDVPVTLYRPTHRTGPHHLMHTLNERGHSGHPGHRPHAHLPCGGPYRASRRCGEQVVVKPGVHTMIAGGCGPWARWN